MEKQPFLGNGKDERWRLTRAWYDSQSHFGRRFRRELIAELIGQTGEDFIIKVVERTQLDGYSFRAW